MKRLGILLCALLLLSGCARATNTGFTLFRSSPIGFQIEYPDSWTKQVDNSAKIAAFLTPTEGFGDEYRDNVTVSAEEIEAGGFADYYADYYATLPATFVGFQEQETADVVIGNREARKIVFSSSAVLAEDGTLIENADEETEGKEIALKIVQYLVDSGSRVHIITFIAAPNSFDYFEPFFNTMLETVKFS